MTAAGEDWDCHREEEVEDEGEDEGEEAVEYESEQKDGGKADKNKKKK